MLSFRLTSMLYLLIFLVSKFLLSNYLVYFFLQAQDVPTCFQRRKLLFGPELWHSENREHGPLKLLLRALNS